MIAESQKQRVRYAKGKEYQTFLFRKVDGRVCRGDRCKHKEQTTEELADLLEVVDAIRKEFGVSEMDLDEVKKLGKNVKKEASTMDACLNKSTIGMDRYVCAVGSRITLGVPTA